MVVKPYPIPNLNLSENMSSPKRISNFILNKTNTRSEEYKNLSGQR